MPKHPRTSAASRGYDATWRRLREHMLRAEPLCRMCQALGRLTPATVVDHIVPIREAPERRLDQSNLQCLCKGCHDSLKQQQERKGYHGAVDASGWPVDPDHPANRRR